MEKLNWAPRTWTNFKKSDQELRKLNPQQKSRYLAYSEPSKDAVNAQSETVKRLNAVRCQKNIQTQKDNLVRDEINEKIKHEKLIGQLKAAEARNRIRIMRLRYENNKTSEINHLIASQSTARSSVRLQALLPISKKLCKLDQPFLNKLQLARIEKILEDETNEDITRNILISS